MPIQYDRPAGGEKDAAARHLGSQARARHSRSGTAHLARRALTSIMRGLRSCRSFRLVDGGIGQRRAQSTLGIGLEAGQSCQVRTIHRMRPACPIGRFTNAREPNPMAFSWSRETRPHSRARLRRAPCWARVCSAGCSKGERDDGRRQWPDAAPERLPHLIDGTCSDAKPGGGGCWSTAAASSGRPPRPQAPHPDGVQPVDLKGKYIIPGLIDLHVHLGHGEGSGTQKAEFFARQRRGRSAHLCPPMA